MVHFLLYDIFYGNNLVFIMSASTKNRVKNKTDTNTVFWELVSLGSPQEMSVFNYYYFEYESNDKPSYTEK